ncbi:hypothetical protein [Exiguobacterium sp. s163]|uniref:hypothetical protein n=1 Tax=Exiguobacterium sp. s163 TaxID=2751287 RepID=UPI001BE99ADE|nr:hypothetical protein [Exiguobacterium sp. s163]
MNQMKERVLLDEIADGEELNVVLNLGEGEVGFGSVLPVGEDDDQFRSNQYMSRFNKGDFDASKPFEDFLSESTLYTGSAKTRLEGLNQILDFWGIEPVSDVHVSKFEQDKDAVDELLASGNDFVIYML